GAPGSRATPANERARNQAIVAVTQRPANPAAEGGVREDHAPVMQGGVGAMVHEVPRAQRARSDHDAFGHGGSATEQAADAGADSGTAQHRENITMALGADALQVALGIEIAVGGKGRRNEDE